MPELARPLVEAEEANQALECRPVGQQELPQRAARPPSSRAGRSHRRRRARPTPPARLPRRTRTPPASASRGTDRGRARRRSRDVSSCGRAPNTSQQSPASIRERSAAVAVSRADAQRSGERLDGCLRSRSRPKRATSSASTSRACRSRPSFEQRRRLRNERAGDALLRRRLGRWPNAGEQPLEGGDRLVVVTEPLQRRCLGGERAGGGVDELPR